MKRQILNKIIWFYAFSVIVLLYAGCDVLGVFSGSTSAEFSLVTELAGVNTTHIPNDKFFYVNLKPGYYEGEGFNPLDALIYAMDDGPGTDCKIPVEEESTDDLYCIMDIMEGDLWYHSLVLEYNVPEGMCDFLDFEVPWHFNQKVGNGPSDVHQCDDYLISCELEDEEYTAETETQYCLGGCTSGTCGSESVTRSCDGEGYYPQDEIQGFCRLRDQGASGTSGLDLSDLELSNCCFGEYELYAGDTVTHGNWGGNLRECIGGLGRISWNSYNKEGKPISLIENTKQDGLIREYKIPSIFSVYDGHRNTNVVKKDPAFVTANYWTDVEDKNFEGNAPRFYRAPMATQLPSSVLEVYDITTGYPYLTWSCLNKAREIKHRIHVAIREWNTQGEFNTFVENKGGRGDPDLEGAEGSICEYYEAGEANILKDTDCNDVWDVDDMESSAEAGSGRQYNPYPEIIYK